MCFKRPTEAQEQAKVENGILNTLSQSMDRCKTQKLTLLGSFIDIINTTKLVIRLMEICHISKEILRGIMSWPHLIFFFLVKNKTRSLNIDEN